MAGSKRINPYTVSATRFGWGTMGSTMRATLVLGVLCICCGVGVLNAQPLDSNYYNNPAHFCSDVPGKVRAVVLAAILQNQVNAAKLLRLFFHDCFVRGCDGSALIFKANGTAERDGNPNRFSLAGFEVIDQAKAILEAFCPRTVSCADIVALAARDSVVALAGPNAPFVYWDVLLGRKDGNISLATDANNNLPPPTFNSAQLMQRFANKSLTKQELVALSGAHTIGTSNCTTIDQFLYPVTNPMYDPSYANYLKSECPRGIKTVRIAMKDFFLPPFSSNKTFDNQYFANIKKDRGLFKSDNALYDDPALKTFVDIYANDQLRFFADFKSAMISMGNIEVKTTGYVRRNCSLAFS